jgi:ABC-type sugar transport system permease subunit
MRKKSLTGLLLSAPSMLLIIMIMVIPLFYTVYCSLFNLDYLQFGGFVGLKNYKRILTNSNIWHSLMTTMIISIPAMIVSLMCGTLLALWADRQTGSFSYLIQLVGLVPWVISMVVGTLLWKWIFDTEMGLFNYFVTTLGFKPVLLFSTPLMAIVTTVFVFAWRTIGYSMVMVLAGLKGLPFELIEAARVDGASNRQIFWKIKLPLIKTPALISSIVLTMSNFNNNTVPMVLTGGGPGNATNVITLEIFRLGFTYYQFGNASALSFITLIINILIIIVYMKAVKYSI